MIHVRSTKLSFPITLETQKIFFASTSTMVVFNYQRISQVERNIVSYLKRNVETKMRTFFISNTILAFDRFLLSPNHQKIQSETETTSFIFISSR